MESQVKKRIGSFLLRNRNKILALGTDDDIKSLELDLTFLWKVTEKTNQSEETQILKTISDFTALFHYFFPTKHIEIKCNEQHVVKGIITSVKQGLDCPKDKAYHWATKEIIKNKRKHLYLDTFKRYYDALPSMYKKLKSLKEYIIDVMEWVKSNIEDFVLEFKIQPKKVKLKIYPIDR